MNKINPSNIFITIKPVIIEDKDETIINGLVNQYSSSENESNDKNKFYEDYDRKKKEEEEDEKMTKVKQLNQNTDIIKIVSNSNEIIVDPNSTQFPIDENSKSNENKNFIKDKNQKYKNNLKKNKRISKKFIIRAKKKAKHNRYSSDRIKQKIFSECKKSFSKTVKKIFESKKIFVFLKVLNNKMENNYTFYKNFCKKTLFQIYCESFPKQIKKSEKELKKQNSDEENNIYEYNKAVIKYAINYENMNDEIKDKILETLFYRTTFSKILIAFLFNRKKIETKNKIINLIGFESFKKSKKLKYLRKKKKIHLLNKRINDLVKKLKLQIFLVEKVIRKNNKH